MSPPNSTEVFDWITPFTSFCAVLFGVMAAHFFTSRRDLASKRRDLVTKHLVDIWNDLDAAGNPKDRSDSIRMERAISNIQLFGTEEMIRIARANTLEFSAKGTTDNLQLLNLLRSQLRSELGLTPTSQKYVALRISFPEEEKSK
jgi:hypothetical protein